MGAQKAEHVDKQTTLVVSTLEQVAAASVRRMVLQRALDVASLDSIPNRVEDLTFFVSGPLYEAAQSVLGEDFADELLLELAPVLDRAWHEDRATVAPPTLDARSDALSRAFGEVTARSEAPQGAQPPSHAPEPSSVPTSNVRKKSAIQRVVVETSSEGLDEMGEEEAPERPREPDSIRIGSEEAEVGERADTIPADDEDDTGPIVAPGARGGAAGDTIPGDSSARAEDSGRGWSAGSSDGWTFTEPPPSSSRPSSSPSSSPSSMGAPSSSPPMPSPSSQDDDRPDAVVDEVRVPDLIVPEVTLPNVVDIPPRGLRAVTVATRDETPPPPRSSRTVPYLQAVLTPPRRRRRVMIVDGRDEPRRALAEALEHAGYAVVTAHDRAVARSLFHRLTPTLIIADVETVAPDFEPLGPAFEELLGNASESHPSPASDVPLAVVVADGGPEDMVAAANDEPPPSPRVLLISDGATRSIPPEVDCVIDRGTDLAGILHEVEGLLPLESQRHM